MKTRIFTLLIAFMATLQLFAVNDFTVDGIGYVKLGGDSVEVGENRDVHGDVVIPATVTFSSKTYRVVAIGPGAWWFTNINSITLPDGIQEIKYGAFGHSGLSSINIPNSVKTIGGDAFRYCNFNSVTIPNGVVSIGEGAFYGCSNLRTITISNSVTEIDGYLFGETNITTPVYNNKFFLYLPYTYSGEYVIPDGISVISEEAFEDRKNLTGVTIPESVHKISKQAFNGCSSISNIDIPANVDTIERGAFSGCVDLTDVYVNSIKPPYVSYSSYYPSDNSFTSNPIIHLACGVDYAKYQKSNWEYYNLEYPEPNYTLTLSSNETQGTINTLHALECNNDTAVIYAQANTGYQFSSWSDGNTDNPRTLLMTQDMTLYANFAVSLYSFTANSEDETKGTITANNGTYQYGTSLTMTATPAEHYHFDHWNIEEEVEDSYLIVSRFLVPASWTNPQAWIWETEGYGHWEQLSKDGEWLIYRTNKDNMHILLAMDQNYTGKTEDIDLTESACYTIADNEGEYYPSVTKSYDCVSIDDYRVVKDTITTTIYENPYTLSIAHNTKATAIFTTEQYQYCKVCHNCYIYSEFGTYQGRGNAGCHTVDAGTIITATVLPNDGYIFQQWADGNTDNPRVFTITQDTTMEAICMRDQSVLTLTCSDNEAGRVFGAGTYDKNTSVQIFAIPNSGYDFAGWSDGNYMNPRYLYMDEAEKTLTANFEITSAAQYVVNVSAQNPALGSAAATNYVRLDAAPFDGCTFVRWSDGNTDNPRYMELNADIELQAIFEGIPSNVESTSSATPNSVHKIIVNDQIFILRGDKTYTVTGQEVE